MNIRYLVAIAVLLGLSLPEVASARLSPEQKCERAVIKAVSVFEAKRTKVLLDCERKLHAGKIEGGVCPDAKTAANLSKAADVATTVIEKSCSSADIGLAGFPQTCPVMDRADGCVIEITDEVSLASCVECLVAKATDLVVSVAAGSFGGVTSNKAVAKCRGAIAASVAKYQGAIAKARRKCLDSSPKGKGICDWASSDLQQSVLKAQEKLMQSIGKKCGGADKVLGGVSPDVSRFDVGIPSECPELDVPGVVDCGSGLSNLRGYVDCNQCVSDFVGHCLGRFAGVSTPPGAMESECAYGESPEPPPPPTGKMIINEFNAVSAQNQLEESGGDSFFGMIPGNGRDWVEFVIIEHCLDIRGYQFQWRDAGPTEGTITFKDMPELSCLSSGTILTIREFESGGADLADPAGPLPDDLVIAPEADDFWMHLEYESGDEGDYIVANDLCLTCSGFSVNNDDWRGRIVDAGGDVVQDWVGENGSGAPIWCGSGVNSSEAGRLEGTPSAAAGSASEEGEACAPPYNDADTTTFGAPNRWTEGEDNDDPEGPWIEQDFSGLRSWVAD